MSQTYNAVNDVDPIETKEWVDAIRSVVENEGVERARFLLEQLLGTSKNEGVNVPAGINTPYQNTIPTSKQVAMPGDHNLEHAIRAAVRWLSMRNTKVWNLVGTSGRSCLPQHCMT